jgi:hypothetical protein
MELAQAANAIPDSNSITTALGITPTELFWAVVIVAVMVIGFWAIVKYNSSDRYTGTTGLAGTKGGRVKRTVTTEEYVDENAPEKV